MNSVNPSQYLSKARQQYRWSKLSTNSAKPKPKTKTEPKTRSEAFTEALHRSFDDRSGVIRMPNLIPEDKQDKVPDKAASQEAGSAPAVLESKPELVVKPQQDTVVARDQSTGLAVTDNGNGQLMMMDDDSQFTCPTNSLQASSREHRIQGGQSVEEQLKQLISETRSQSMEQHQATFMNLITSSN